jgi:hypothetical protein
MSRSCESSSSEQTLPEIAEYFGTNRYATVSRNRRVEFKMAKKMKFKDRIEKIAASINQRQT